MIRVLGIVGLTLAAPLSAAMAQDCPPVQFSDRKDAVKVGVTISLLTKFVSSLGFSPGWEHENKSIPPQSDDFYFKTVAFGAACRQIAANQSLTFDQRQSALRGWVSLLYNVSNPVPPSAPAPSAALPTSPPQSPTEAKRNVALLIAHPPARQSAAAPIIIRVFMKSNIRERGVAALQATLPNFDIRIGKSDIDPENSADVLFVNRSTVSRSSVIQVIKALESQGVRIKSVQQSDAFLGSKREIQIGTIINPKNGDQTFEQADPLDIADLESLHGNDFWQAAFNGKVYCNNSVGFGQWCHMSDDARPVP